MAGTSSAQGISIGEPLLNTTTTLGWAAAIAWIALRPPPGLYEPLESVEAWDHRQPSPDLGVRYQGTGLGLSLSQNILKNHNGLIECDSHDGRTCFTLSIPLSNEAEEHTE